MGADCAVHIVKFLSAHNVTHVTDPFCGKGTVLAAANAFGISAQGVDLSSKQGAYHSRSPQLLSLPLMISLQSKTRSALFCAAPPPPFFPPIALISPHQTPAKCSNSVLFSLTSNWISHSPKVLARMRRKDRG